MASEQSSVVKASLFAGLVGAGIALLFAPRSGKATRYRIRQTLMNAEEFGKQKLMRQKSETEQTLDRLKDWDNTRNQPPVLTKWEEEV